MDSGVPERSIFRVLAELMRFFRGENPRVNLRPIRESFPWRNRKFASENSREI
jgi:hypothetical protein